jgi:DNA-3-methyladenine glycosylase II
MKKAVEHLKSSDAILASIIERVGECRMSYRDPSFEALARAIVFQQLSTKAANTIYGRLEEAAGGRMTPEAIANLTLGEMRRAGLSKQKTGYVRDLADHVQSGRLDFSRIGTMGDEEVIVALTDIKGIGVWTAHMFLMFALRRPNVLPVGDLGVRIAIQRLYRKRKLPVAKDIQKIAKGWHPYCSYAAWYLWRSLELKDLAPKKKAKRKAAKKKPTTGVRRRGGKKAGKRGKK